MNRDELDRLVAEFAARRAQMDRLWQEAETASQPARRGLSDHARVNGPVARSTLHLLRSEAGLALRRAFPARIRILDIDALARLEVEGQPVEAWCEWRIP